MPAVSAAPLLTIYYGGQRFMLLADDFVLDRRQSPYRRLAATLLYARRAPFRIEIEGFGSLSAWALLLTPKLRRRLIHAPASQIAIFDYPMGTAGYRRLAPLLREAPVHACHPAAFAALHPALDAAAQGRLEADEALALHRHMAEAIAPPVTAESLDDLRIARTLARIAQLPLDQVMLTRLAAAEGLSASRLRHLFSAETGSTVSHYARWLAVWRAVDAWRPGLTWTRLAQDAGFHDLAHFDHAFLEVFGLKPSRVFDPQRVCLRSLLSGSSR